MTSAQKIVWSVVAIIALLLIGAGFYFSNRVETPVETTENPTSDVPAPVTIDVKHQYIDGTHTVAGSIDLPTPCHRLQTRSDVNQAENIATIVFNASAGTSTDACAQVISSVPFKVQFNANADVNIVGTFNNKSVNLNIFEVPADENIDTFEIYTKG